MIAKAASRIVTVAGAGHGVAPVRDAAASRSSRLRCFAHFFGDALDGADDLVGFHDGTTTADLPRSVYSTRGQAMCSDQDHRLVPVGALLAEDRIEALAEAAELAERVDDAGRPVDAGRPAGAIGVRAPAEGGLDDPRHAVGGVHDPPVIEALHLAAVGGEARLEVVAADDAKRSRLDRLELAFIASRRRAIVPWSRSVAVDERGQRRPRQTRSPRAPPSAWPCRSGRGTRSPARARCASGRGRHRGRCSRRSGARGAPGCTSGARSGPTASTSTMPDRSPRSARTVRLPRASRPRG